MTIKQLKEKRANVWAEMQNITLQAEGRSMSAEELSQWEGFEGELNTLTKEIRVKERDAKLGAEDFATSAVDNARVADPESEPAVDDSEKAYRDAWAAHARFGGAALTSEQRTALTSGYTVITANGEQRAAGTGTTAGGYFVPQGFRQTIIQKLKAYGQVRDAATIISTDTGNTLPWPTNDDTGNVGAILAENTAVTEQDVVLGQAQLGAYMYTSKLIRVSLQLLQDSAFDFETFLAGRFAERLGRATNAHFTTGTGTAQPQGIVTGATTGVTGAVGTTTTVTFNSLVSLIHSVDPAYRTANSKFMMNDASLAAIRIIRDDSGGAGIGRPLWEPSIQPGVPDSLLGYPVVVNNDMATMAANARSILFGDFAAGYVIRDVLGIQSLRLEERYADFLQVGFLAFLRTDGLVQDSSALKVYINSAT